MKKVTLSLTQSTDYWKTRSYLHGLGLEHSSQTDEEFKFFLVVGTKQDKEKLAYLKKFLSSSKIEFHLT